MCKLITQYGFYASYRLFLHLMSKSGGEVFVIEYLSMDKRIVFYEYEPRVNVLVNIVY